LPALQCHLYTFQKQRSFYQDRLRESSTHKMRDGVSSYRMRRHREEQAKLAKEEAEAAVRGRPILSAHLNVETAGHEPKRPEI
jgi:hypothetical protein